MQRPAGLQHEVLDTLVDLFDPHRESEAVEGYERRTPRPDDLEVRRRQRELEQRDTTRAGRRSR